MKESRSALGQSCCSAVVRSRRRTSSCSENICSLAASRDFKRKIRSTSGKNKFDSGASVLLFSFCTTPRTAPSPAFQWFLIINLEEERRKDGAGRAAEMALERNINTNNNKYYFFLRQISLGTFKRLTAAPPAICASLEGRRGGGGIYTSAVHQNKIKWCIIWRIAFFFLDLESPNLLSHKNNQL